MDEGKYETINLDSWDSLRDMLVSKQFRGWAFRGQADASWKLFSSLSRYLLQNRVNPKAWEQQESRILRIFRRKAHLFLAQPPSESDSFEWLSIMQHHGAPTRLLDFTWSPYVAAFFALQHATKAAAIWAIFPPELLDEKYRTTIADQRTSVEEIGPWVIGNYESIFIKNNRSIVVIGEPHRMNQRLIAQSGTFAMPGVLDVPVECIAPKHAVKKIVIDSSKTRKLAMQELYKMNVSEATLFPGLDGMARSLAYELESHWAFDPETMEIYPGFHMQ